MTEIETEVKTERESQRPEQKTTNAFSSRTFSSTESDLNKFEQYKPVDLKGIYNKLEREAKQQEESDLDKFTKIEDDQAPFSVSKTVNVEEKVASVKVNLKGKLTIFVAGVALSLITFLSIFNAVKISKLKTQVSSLNSEIYYNEQVIESKVSTYNALTDESLLRSKAENLGFDKISQQNSHKVKIKRVKSNSSDKKLKGENWFDKVCSWISGLFGV